MTTSNEFIINDDILRQEAERIVADTLAEAKGDIQDAIRWRCDSHEWVIYYDKALKLCADCNTIEDTSQTFGSIGEHAAAVAYKTLVYACQDALTQRGADEKVERQDRTRRIRIWGQPNTDNGVIGPERAG